MACVLLVIYYTYYFIFFRLYSWGKNYDITIVNMNLQMPDEKKKKIILIMFLILLLIELLLMIIYENI